MSQKEYVKELTEKFGRKRGEELINMVDKLDEELYGVRYLTSPVKHPTYEDLTPLTRKRLLKELDKEDIID